jgi:hypothetical protein
MPFYEKQSAIRQSEQKSSLPTKGSTGLSNNRRNPREVKKKEEDKFLFAMNVIA